MSALAVGGALAILAAGAADSEKVRAGQAATAFYEAYVAGDRPSGVPEEGKLRQLEPFTSKRLMRLLREALAHRERWITLHSAERGPDGQPLILKPPLVDGALFCSSFEGFTSVSLGRVARAARGYRVSMNFSYAEPGQTTVRWMDVAIVVKEVDRFVVDDVELLGDWPFGYHGRVSDILKSRE